MSMKKLANETGVCYRSIIAYEHGVAQPSMRNLLKLCKVLDLQVTLTPNEDIDKLEY